MPGKENKNGSDTIEAVLLSVLCEKAAPRSVGFQTFQQVLHAFVNFVVGERVVMDNVFANGAIGKAVVGMVDQVKDDGAFTILDGVGVVARRSIEAVPAAVIAADESSRIDRSGDALTARPHGELIVHQKVSIGRVADLQQTAAVEFLFEGPRNAVANNVVFPIRVALIRRDAFVIRAVTRWPAVKGIPRGDGAMRGGRRPSGTPSPGHALANGDGGVAVHDDTVVAARKSDAAQNRQECES